MKKSKLLIGTALSLITLSAVVSCNQEEKISKGFEEAIEELKTLDLKSKYRGKMTSIEFSGLEKKEQSSAFAFNDDKKGFTYEFMAVKEFTQIIKKGNPKTKKIITKTEKDDTKLLATILIIEDKTKKTKEVIIPLSRFKSEADRLREKTLAGLAKELEKETVSLVEGQKGKISIEYFNNLQSKKSRKSFIDSKNINKIIEDKIDFDVQLIKTITNASGTESKELFLEIIIFEKREKNTKESVLMKIESNFISQGKVKKEKQEEIAKIFEKFDSVSLVLKPLNEESKKEKDVPDQRVTLKQFFEDLDSKKRLSLIIFKKDGTLIPQNQLNNFEENLSLIFTEKKKSPNNVTLTIKNTNPSFIKMNYSKTFKIKIFKTEAEKKIEDEKALQIMKEQWVKTQNESIKDSSVKIVQTEFLDILDFLDLKDEDRLKKLTLVPNFEKDKKYLIASNNIVTNFKIKTPLPEAIDGKSKLTQDQKTKKEFSFLVTLRYKVDHSEIKKTETIEILIKNFEPIITKEKKWKKDIKDNIENILIGNPLTLQPGTFITKENFIKLSNKFISGKNLFDFFNGKIIKGDKKSKPGYVPISNQKISKINFATRFFKNKENLCYRLKDVEVVGKNISFALEIKNNSIKLLGDIIEVSKSKFFLSGFVSS